MDPHLNSCSLGCAVASPDMHTPAEAPAPRLCSIRLELAEPIPNLAEVAIAHRTFPSLPGRRRALAPRIPRFSPDVNGSAVSLTIYSRLFREIPTCDGGRSCGPNAGRPPFRRPISRNVSCPRHPARQPSPPSVHVGDFPKAPDSKRKIETALGLSGRRGSKRGNAPLGSKAKFFVRQALEIPRNREIRDFAVLVFSTT